MIGSNFKPTIKMTEAEYVALFQSHIDSGMLTEAYVKARYAYETGRGSYQQAHEEYIKTRAHKEQLETNKRYPA